jgi:hypothetical protein
VIDGREEVLVFWESIWEPAKEYPREEVDKVKKKRKRTETVSRRAKMNKRQPNAQGWPHPSLIGGKRRMDRQVHPPDRWMGRYAASSIRR